ncbi:hypothetical protein [Adlercreutzia sp. ZJ304]|uniref:hypothetical protein n=1 Tax=Adlercreutzia sp. ZJ304 TaxID=2709791 RepID=UPI0013EB4A09|nr:hypothetical protein [Adlercreutzia sp. ZJ304]
MKNSSRVFTRKSISLLSALALISTLTPAAAFAVASDEYSAAQDASQDTQSISTSETAQDGQKDTADAMQNAKQPEVALPEEKASSLPGLKEDAIVDVPEIVSASVNLDSQELQPVIVSSNGLTFQVNSQDATKASCIGWNGNALQGNLVIPEQIDVAGTQVTVTKICLGGGI